MSKFAEIKAAIQDLPGPEVEQLALWIETLPQRRRMPLPVESWLIHAPGAAISGMRTKDVMALTRGEQ